MSQYDLSRRVVDQVREAADIVQVIGEVVTLRKTGRNHLGLCPFHGERTASFNVSREKGTFYCFGCKKGGDVIDFVMEIERLSFPEAVERLAERFGVELPAASPDARRQRSESDQLVSVLEAAQAVLIRRVSEDRPRAFLERRGVSLEVAAEFGLGYAPAEWRWLYDELHRRFADRTLIAAGLVVEGDGGRVWDRFRDRVTIPIRDPRGRIIAFGGRTLGDDPAKYLNSPETPLFSKSHVLYMFDRATRVFGQTDRAIVVEGYFDCIALQGAGFREAVATLGTALSEHHARELARKVECVVVCFDGDDAGRNAARTALRTLLATGVQVRILLLPEGRDPDDIVRKEGAPGIAGRLETSLDPVDFLMDRAGGSAGERRARLAECLEIVDVTPDPTRRYTLQAELAKRAQIPLDQIRPMQSPRVIAAQTSSDNTALPLEMALLRALLIDLPIDRRGLVAQEVPVELLATPVVCRVMEAIKAVVAEHGTLEISALKSHIDDRDARRLLAALEHEAPETPEDRLSLILRELWERQRKRRLAELSNRIAQAERQGDHDQLTELSLEWSLLLKQPKKL